MQSLDSVYVPLNDEAYITLYQQLQPLLDAGRNVIVHCPEPAPLFWLSACLLRHWPDYAVKVTQEARQYCLSARQDSLDTVILSWPKASDRIRLFLCKSHQEWASFEDIRTFIVHETVRLAQHRVPLAAQRLKIAPSTLYRWLSQDA